MFGIITGLFLIPSNQHDGNKDSDVYIRIRDSDKSNLSKYTSKQTSKQTNKKDNEEMRK